MSGYTCRETYYNYGSYLRSRGYDQAICNLFTEIEAGKVKVGPIVPHGECNVTINGNVLIKNCDDPAQGAGILSLWGGSADDPLAYSNFGLQAYTGAHFVGPIVQTAGGNVVATPNNPAGAGNEISNSTAFSRDVTIQSTLSVAGATTLSDTLGVTGATTLSDTLDVTGNVYVNSDKLTIDSTNGNTDIAGNLVVTGTITGALNGNADTATAIMNASYSTSGIGSAGNAAPTTSIPTPVKGEMVLETHTSLPESTITYALWICVDASTQTWKRTLLS